MCNIVRGKNSNFTFVTCSQQWLHPIRHLYYSSPPARWDPGLLYSTSLMQEYVSLLIGPYMNHVSVLCVVINFLLIRSLYLARPQLPVVSFSGNRTFGYRHKYRYKKFFKLHYQRGGNSLISNLYLCRYRFISTMRTAHFEAAETRN